MSRRRTQAVGSAIGFIKVYQKSIRNLERIAEEGTSFEVYERTPERLVAAVWFDQQLDQDNLRTVDGRRLRVLSPGRWNTGPGPDFIGARLKLARGPVREGDVEVHVFASDWDRHRHADDPRYANVTLSVCMWNDLRLIKESEIPIVELFPYLIDERILLGHAVDSYPYASRAMRGKCSPLVDKARMEKALNFIAAAGDARIQRKSARMESLSRTFGYDQTIYKGLMEAAGYSANKKALSHLADVLHLELLRSVISRQAIQRRREALLALLYGSCGFFEKYPDDQLAAPLARLRLIWEELRSEKQLVVIRGIKLARSRPANNPYRRMAAIAHLLSGISGLKLFDYFLAALGNVENPAPNATRAAGRRLRELLTSLSDPFWDYHVSPSGKRTQRPQKLIGNGLASIVVVNILIPLMLAYARRQQRWNLEVFLHELLCRFGGQAHNALTRFTCGRILGPEQLQPSFATNARLHQGLLQIYYDFCRSLREGCEECEFADFLVEDM